MGLCNISADCRFFAQRARQEGLGDRGVDPGGCQGGLYTRVASADDGDDVSIHHTVSF